MDIILGCVFVCITLKGPSRGGMCEETSIDLIAWWIVLFPVSVEPAEIMITMGRDVQSGMMWPINLTRLGLKQNMVGDTFHRLLLSCHRQKGTPKKGYNWSPWGPASRAGIPESLCAAFVPLVTIYCIDFGFNIGRMCHGGQEGWETRGRGLFTDTKRRPKALPPSWDGKEIGHQRLIKPSVRACLTDRRLSEPFSLWGGRLQPVNIS